MCAERWQAEGVALDKLLLVTPDNLRELGWAAEEILRSGVYPLMLAWLPPIGFALRRRLKIATEQGQSLRITPYPAGMRTAPASPAWGQMAVRRIPGAVAVRRLKPFHPREAHLELDAGGAHSTSLDEMDATPLALLGAR